MISLVGGELYQWDTGRVVQVTNGSDVVVHEVHFTTRSMDFAYVVRTYEEDGEIYCAIPNAILQQYKSISCYEVCENSSGEQSISTTVLNVIKRNRPDDYVYTEPERLAFKQLENRIDDLENRPAGIQSDWNQTDEESLEFIKNKPTIPVHTKPDWNQNDSSASDYVRHRTHYMDYIKEDISGTTYSFKVTAESGSHNLSIPFEPGQVWNITYGSYTSPEITVGAGTMYINNEYHIGVSSATDRVHISESRYEIGSSKYANIGNANIVVTCVSGAITKEKPVTIPPKYLPPPTYLKGVTQKGAVVTDVRDEIDTKLNSRVLSDPAGNIYSVSNVITYDKFENVRYDLSDHIAICLNSGTYSDAFPDVPISAYPVIMMESPTGYLCRFANGEIYTAYDTGITEDDNIDGLTNVMRMTAFYAEKTETKLLKDYSSFGSGVHTHESLGLVEGQKYTITYSDGISGGSTMTVPAVYVEGLGMVACLSDNTDNIEGNRFYIGDTQSYINPGWKYQMNASLEAIYANVPVPTIPYSAIKDAPEIPQTSNELFVVNVSVNDTGGFTADKTFEEIMTAYESGITLTCCVFNAFCIPVYMVLPNEGAIIFAINVFVVEPTPDALIYMAVMINAQDMVMLEEFPWPTMTGATSSEDGSIGLVPVPTAGDQDKVLSGAGTWVSIPDQTIINSSTEGSTKKFRITVDDAGTISATEVTET